MSVLTTGLLFSAIILTVSGTGNPVLTGLTGVALCGMGLMQEKIQVDKKIIFFLFGYNSFSLVSTCINGENPFRGYVFDHLLCTVIIFLAGTLDQKGRACLRRRGVLWSAFIASAGIVQFVISAFHENAGRLGGIFQNANVMGIFLVFSWFSLMECRNETEKKKTLCFLDYVEPLLLYAVALTLSMGSFVAMALGVLIMAACHKLRYPEADTVWFTLRVLAKASLGVGGGFLLYIASTRVHEAWLDMLIVCFLAAVVVKWRKLDVFLSTYRRMTGVISGFGIIVAISVILFRISSIATFTERMEMMRAGISYILRAPVFGVGSLQWHLLDMSDGGKYFNTWYIHDMFIHIGVEIGIPAMLLLIAASVGILRKRRPPELTAGVVALMLHYVLDVGFVFAGIAATAEILLGTRGEQEKTFSSAASKFIFAGALILFVCGVYQYVS